MALYQVTIAYDGTEFKGFQRQKNSRSVQSEIEQALRRLNWQEESLLSAGRTDSGVHAEGQVVAFQLDWQHSEEELKNALNDLLPSDISVQTVSQANAKFHPRFAALAREYRYQIYFSENSKPLKERFYWRVWPMPEIKVLQQGSRLFKGKHDFCAFGRAPDDKSPTQRTIQSAGWEIDLEANEAYFRIRAKAFLYHMVRRIVYVLVRAGQKRIGLEEIQACIERQKELPAGIAPAKGLILERIIY